MTKESIIKLYNHFCKLAEGKFIESDFNFKLKGEGGRTEIGEMTPQKRELIISDALRSKEELETKRFKDPKTLNCGDLCYPFLTNKPEKEDKIKKKA